jgi:hypothetical protein
MLLIVFFNKKKLNYMKIDFIWIGYFDEFNGTLND